MRKSASLLVAAALGSLVALLVIWSRGPSHGGAARPAAELRPEGAPPLAASPAKAPLPAPTVPIAGAPASFVELIKRARPSVVNIRSTSLIRQRPVAVFPFGENSPFYRLVQPPDERAQSLGSGVIISADGDILTNNHVIAPEELGRPADEILVLLDDKRQFLARVVARDPPTDIALLHIDNAPPLQPALLGSSDRLEVGEWVVAIGEPFGLQSTVTAGIVSAKGRRGDDLGQFNRGYWDFIQTDAAINPGNSGGPLYNMRGEVVGINTAINAKAQGLAFAVPIDMAKRDVEDFKRYGRVQRGWTGIRPIEPSKLGLQLRTGALVGMVAADSPAAQVGIRPGDIILTFDGVKVDDAERLRWLTANAGVGKKVTLTVRRGEHDETIGLVTAAESPRPNAPGE